MSTKFERSVDLSFSIISLIHRWKVPEITRVSQNGGNWKRISTDHVSPSIPRSFSALPVFSICRLSAFFLVHYVSYEDYLRILASFSSIFAYVGRSGTYYHSLWYFGLLFYGDLVRIRFYPLELVLASHCHLWSLAALTHVSIFEIFRLWR